VDDFFVTAKNLDDIHKLHDALVERYDSVKINVGSKLKFLGMEFQFVETLVCVKIDLSDLLKDVVGTAENPCGMNLFHSREDSPLLDKSSQAIFHSTVAKILYIAKRTRADVLLPINFLCTKVQRPTEEDQGKLLRVLKYLKGTEDLVLQIGMPTNEDGSVDLKAYIDAAYSVHEDCKSHSGAAFTFGSGAFLPCSTKQACVSKSSTEAELIAYTDYIGEAMTLKNIAQDITGKQVNLIIMQDNSSVISILKNGRLAGKSKHCSKHVKTRVAWIKERQDAKDFSTDHCPTTLMISDGFTKPKTIDQHSEFRNMVGIVPPFPKERAGNIGKPELRPELRPATTGATTRPSVRASEIVRPILKHADVKTEEDDVDDDDIALLRT